LHQYPRNVLANALEERMADLPLSRIRSHAGGYDRHFPSVGGLGSGVEALSRRGRRKISARRRFSYFA
jgi:hypothetical protein